MKKQVRFTILVGMLCLNLFGQQQYGWIQKAGFPGPARHRATGATVGNRGYMGLGHVNAVFDILYDDWFEYDPGSDTWTQKASYPGGPRFHAACFVINNIVYVGTGRDINATLHQDFWKYDPVTNSWSSVANFTGSARRGAVGFTINGYGYVGTGSGTSSFFRYDPSNNSWSQMQSFPGGGRTSAVGFSINGKGYISTGDAGGPTNDCWEYDPTLNSWTQKANLPGLARMEAGGFVLGGKGYVGTGDDFSSGTNYQDFWCFNPQTNSWTQVTDFGGAARRYLTCFAIGNRAYAGLGTSGINYADLWEFGTISGTEEEIETVSINAWPQPADEQVHLQLSDALSQATIRLYDLNGRMLREETFTGMQYSLARNGLAAGVYYLRIEENGTEKGTQKIIFR